MTKNRSPPIIVGLIGAYIGLEYPFVVVGLVSVLVTIHITMRFTEKQLGQNLENAEVKLNDMKLLNPKSSHFTTDTEKGYFRS